LKYILKGILLSRTDEIIVAWFITIVMKKYVLNFENVSKSLKTLKTRDSKEYVQIQRLLIALKRLGPGLKRPQAAPIRKGIHELRPRKHRLLYIILPNNEILLLGLFKKSGSSVSTKDFNTAYHRVPK